jgi:exodeoxyribonuclease VII large subunit
LALSPAFDAVAERLHDAASRNADAEHRLKTAITMLLHDVRSRFSAASSPLSPTRLRAQANAARDRLSFVSKACEANIAARIENAGQQLGIAMAALDAMSPLKVLERGYAIAQNAQGKIVREASTVDIGDALRVRLWKGALDCRVEKTENE